MDLRRRRKFKTAGNIGEGAGRVTRLCVDTQFGFKVVGRNDAFDLKPDFGARCPGDAGDLAVNNLTHWAGVRGVYSNSKVEAIDERSFYLHQWHRATPATAV